jgi:hypothetical protein
LGKIEKNAFPMSVRVFLLVAFSVTHTVYCTPFQNLGFDDANTNNPAEISNGQVFGRPEDFVPGWEMAPLWPQGLVGLNQFPTTGYGYASIFSEARDAIQVDGRYSLYMFQSSAGQWTLNQTGDIPDGARALHFLSYDAHVSLTLDGTDIPLVYVPRSLTPACCGLLADASWLQVTRFAAAALRFSAAVPGLTVRPPVAT